MSGGPLRGYYVGMEWDVGPASWPRSPRSRRIRTQAQHPARSPWRIAETPANPLSLSVTGTRPIVMRTPWVFTQQVPPPHEDQSKDRALLPKRTASETVPITAAVRIINSGEKRPLGPPGLSVKTRGRAGHRTRRGCWSRPRRSWWWFCRRRWRCGRRRREVIQPLVAPVPRLLEALCVLDQEVVLEPVAHFRTRQPSNRGWHSRLRRRACDYPHRSHGIPRGRTRVIRQSTDRGDSRDRWTHIGNDRDPPPVPRDAMDRLR